MNTALAWRRPRTRDVLSDPLLWLLAGIIVLGALTSPFFLTGQNITNLLRNAAVVGLLATGFAVVLMTGRIDLSVAAVMVFSVIAGLLVSIEIGKMLGVRWTVRGNTFAGPPFLAIAITLVAGTGLGLINGLGSVGLKVASFIFTLISMSALRGISYLMTGGAPIYLGDGPFRWLGEGSVLGLPVGFVAFVAIAVVLHLFLTGSVAGRRVHAIGGNEKAAVYSGVSSGRIVVLTFAISGFCAAMAGVFFSARLMSIEAALGQGYELIAITIAVIGGVALSGGTGSVLKVLLAAVTFSAGLNLLAIWGVATWYQNLAIGVTLIVTVILTRWQQRDRPA